MTSRSSPAAKNVSIASRGVQTIGCPLTLKDVFRTIGIPVISENASMIVQKRWLVERATVCTRAVPSTCVTAGRVSWNCGRTRVVNSIQENVPTSLGFMSKYLVAASSSTAGAKGRKASRFFTRALI